MGHGARRWLLVEPARPARVREWHGAAWLAVGTVCIGAFMGQLDASIVSLALPTLRSAFGVSLGAVEWVTLAYLVVLVSAVVAVGAVADRVGRKLLYIYGFVVFGVASAACGVAPGFAALIAARVVQAFGAAMLQANSVALVKEAAPPGRLGRAIGMQGAAQALGLAAGPAVGGVLIGLGGWRLVFLVNIPLAVLGTALAWVLLPRSRSFSDRVRLRVPMRGIAAGLALAFVAYLTLFGTLFAVPFFLQLGLQRSAAAAGFELCVLPLALALVAPWAGRLGDRFGPRLPALLGMLIASVALGAAAAAHGSESLLLLEMALLGAGLGLQIPANNAMVMAAAPPQRTGVVGGLLNMTRGVGMAAGVAAAGLAFSAAGGTEAGGASRGLSAACATLAVAGLAGVALGLRGSRARRR
ncbi:MAG TPA: MFS transporter [Candidatus Dormibacteraeota bacterium]|nr:MFS transporter [Candidatus Dormibacteraeota bacterium]